MEPILISTLVVALAEIGDRTQLLAMVLATRFRRPIPILAGILAATLANHGLAATVGYFAADLLKGRWFQYVVAASFFATAAWTLVPDKEDDLPRETTHFGVFLTTAIAFFLVEMGDKTQIATISLAARFHQILLVAIGTTLGMMAANIPAVLLGEAATRWVPLKAVRIGAAVLFAALGVWTLFEAIHA
ncbi:MAG: TMEM165/GDT1 family protein [Caulobacteraceae bacterium]|nr:TMEM165/GDT1 family protein [Caulobacteraceae bacterium]